MAHPVGHSDGDTKIVLSSQRVILLHSKTLTSASSTFRELLEPTYFETVETVPHPKTKSHTETAPEPGTAPNRRVGFELVLVENPQVADEDEVGFILEPVKVKGRHRRRSDHRTSDGVIASLEYDGGSDEIHYVIDAYCSVLGIFHGQPIDIGNFEEDGLVGMLGKAIFVAYVAEYLKCVSQLTAKIEAVFLAIGQRFYLSVANHPAPWLKFAHRIRSFPIFKEALIHATGRYMTKSMQNDLQDMPECIASIVSKKAKILQNRVRHAEKSVAAYFPTPMQRDDSGLLIDKDTIGRSSYSNDILMWMALTAFRQFHSSCLLDKETFNAPDMGYGFIMAIYEGGEAYCNRQHLVGFHDLFPMSHKGKTTIEHRLNEIKQHVKQFALPLLISHSQLNLTDYPQAHFTCAYVQPDDYSWLQS